MLFSYKNMRNTFLSLPKEDGRDPVKELLDRLITCKPMRLPISSGMLPVILLDPSRIELSDTERLENEPGRAPLNLLSVKSKSINWEQFVSAVMKPQSFGCSVPTRLLKRIRWLRFLNLPISPGTTPLRKLLLS